ncbi:MAG: hypothetical protein PHR35_04190, partial [Kiritimatiellae bacterium]|nr:hypothetical protein [Kiritimatiellia bacterium]
MNDELLKTFKSPGAAYRGKPFWAWNGRLEEGELRRQIRLMRQMGLGGFCMHSRAGLVTPYLSDEWFRLVNACVDEARKQGMEAWLYDEDRWPSGAAGGLVTRQAKYRQRFLRMEPVRSFRWSRDVLAAFTAELTGDLAARNVRPLARGKRPARLADGETYLVFRLVTAARSDWYNGATYLDALSHEAVSQFIKITHRAYAKRCGHEFGKTISAIFCDEPNHGLMLADETASEGAPQGAVHVPWTPKFPAIFRKRHGYDILPHIVEVFFEVDGQAVTPACYHYHDCVTHLFVDAYARQIDEWCERAGIAFTGHVLAEDTLASQSVFVGSAMRFYEHMRWPGIDMLTECWRGYGTAKQLASAARQFGRRWRMTEIYGCTGWDFAFAGHKAIGDWQAALGINMRCQHLSWYTMEGEAKRDYPASIFYQSPWWDLYPKVEDYFARIHAVMTRGAEVRDLLVIHPVESVWVQLKKQWLRDPRRINEYDQMLAELSDSLLSQHVDFDYGDEELLARHGSVRRQGESSVLKVGKAAYKAVVVPPLITMRATTLELL